MTIYPPPQTEEFIGITRRLTPTARVILRGIMLAHLARRKRKIKLSPQKRTPKIYFIWKDKKS